MHVLWLIPDYYSFLREELEAVASVVDRLSVISQAPPMSIPGVHAETIPADRLALHRVSRRVAGLVQAGAKSPWPRTRADFRSLWRVARHNEFIGDFVRREQVDVIHSHFAVPEGTAGWQAAHGRPVILTLRGVDILTVADHGYGFMLSPFYRRTIATTFRRVARVTVASRQAYDAALAAGAPASALQLLPNGVNLRTFFRDARAAEGVRRMLGVGTRPLLVAAGNLVPNKAFDRLITAFGHVHSQQGKAELTLVIAGEGPERPTLERLVAKAGLSATVRLPGRLKADQMRGLLSAASVLVHPSLSEGFGNIVVEAMAVGCPVLATATGAARDLITDGINGRLVPPGDTEALVTAIRDLLDDAPVRARYTERSADVVRNGLTLEHRAAAIRRLYDQVSVARHR